MGSLRELVACDRGFNLSDFCDRVVDASIDRAQAAGGAGAAWQQAERRIAARAPLVPLASRRQLAVTSARAGNVQFHPLTGVLLDQTWVQ